MSKMVILVTGSAVGIGRGVCESFATQGATIIALDVDEAENQETHLAIESAGGVCFSYACDISDKQAVKAVFSDLATKVDHIDLLLNNAAVYNDTTLTGGDWEKQTAAFDQAMGACAMGAFYCTAAAVPLLTKAGHANIINVITDHVKEGHYLTGGPATGYDCAKFSLLRLTENWAVELKSDGVRVNGLCFGATNTPMLRKFSPQLIPSAMNVDDLCQAVRNVMDQGPDGATGQSYEFGMGPTQRAESLLQIEAIRSQAP